MEYRLVNEKYVFNKDGVHFALTKDQVRDMRDSLNEILDEFTITFSEEALEWLNEPIDD